MPRTRLPLDMLSLLLSWMKPTPNLSCFLSKNGVFNPLEDFQFVITYSFAD